MLKETINLRNEISGHGQESTPCRDGIPYFYSYSILEPGISCLIELLTKKESPRPFNLFSWRVMT